MVDKAEAAAEVELEPDEEELEQEESTEEQEAEQAEGTEEEKTAESEPEEFEIVVDGEAGSQPEDTRTQQINTIVARRVNREKAKTKAATEATEEERKRNTLLEEQNRLLQLQLNQAPQTAAPARPKPQDFTDGADDPAYLEAIDSYYEARSEKRVQEAVAKATADFKPVRSDQPDPALVESQRRHYGKAVDLGIKDYEETEQAAIDIIGQKNVDLLIQNSSDSHLVLYHLGKNESEARRISGLLSDPKTVVKGVLDIGKLEGRLKVVPKAKAKPAPGPDEENEGSISSKLKERGPKGATFE